MYGFKTSSVIKTSLRNLECPTCKNSVFGITETLLKNLCFLVKTTARKIDGPATVTQESRKEIDAFRRDSWLGKCSSDLVVLFFDMAGVLNFPVSCPAWMFSCLAYLLVVNYDLLVLQCSNLCSDKHRCFAHMNFNFSEVFLVFSEAVCCPVQLRSFNSSTTSLKFSHVPSPNKKVPVSENWPKSYQYDGDNGGQK